jgi:N,N'-diacetyllegionaminate synthase
VVNINSKTIIIAEIGVNHDGSLKKAIKLIDEAVKAGADIVKFQTYNTDNLVLQDAEKPQYQKQNLPAELSQYAMLKSLEMSDQMFEHIYNYCNKNNIFLMSTAYSVNDLKKLEKYNLKWHKLASIDIVDHRLIKAVALTNKKTIISTGMANLSEINDAVEIFSKFGNKNNLVLLQCVFNYPCEVGDLNLNVIDTYKNLFNVEVGLSDHSESTISAAIAIAMGATIVEKHITLSKKDPGPDHKASMEINEFKIMVKNIRDAEKMLGNKFKEPLSIEIESRNISRKSLVSLEDIKQGDLIQDHMIGAKRPGKGLFPTFNNLKKIIGKKANQDIKKNDIFDLSMIKSNNKN